MLMFGIFLPLLLLLLWLFTITSHLRLPLVLLALHAKRRCTCPFADLLLGFFPDLVFARGYLESTWSL
jgi:hypothetical protein